MESYKLSGTVKESVNGQSGPNKENCKEQTDK